MTGQLVRVDVELFCSGCSGTNPAITLSIRNTTGTTPVPTGADLATATLAGFNDGGAGGLKTFTFSSPITLTPGTRYAFVFRANAARTGTYAYTCSCGTGSSNFNPYAGGQFVTSSNSGSTWAADTTVGGRDLNFVTYVNPGYSDGTFVSSSRTRTRPSGLPDVDDALVFGHDARRHGRQVPGRRQQLVLRPVQLRRARRNREHLLHDERRGLSHSTASATSATRRSCRPRTAA